MTLFFHGLAIFFVVPSMSEVTARIRGRAKHILLFQQEKPESTTGFGLASKLPIRILATEGIDKGTEKDCPPEHFGSFML